MRLMMSRFGAIRFMKRFEDEDRILNSIKIRIILLIAMLSIYSQSKAWIAYGFKSGMSRFDVVRYLSEKESLVITDGAQQTYAGPINDRAKYNLIYCSTPQKLYLMRFSLDDTLEEFVKTKEKYEKRYGKPTSLGSKSDNWDSETWENIDTSFIWDTTEYETILLTHTTNGTIAEFQDLSVC